MSGIFKPNWESQNIYNALKPRILELDDRIEEIPTKSYIGFRIGRQVMVRIDIFKSKLVLGLNRVEPEDLDDPKNKVKYREFSYSYFGKHISDYVINDVKDIDYAIFLTKQVCDKFFKNKD